MMRTRGKKDQPLNFKRFIRHIPQCFQKALAIIIFISAIFVQQAFSQVELTAWGNITGIRVEGQLMEFETSLRVVGSNWTEIASTGKERQRPEYSREGNTQVVSTRIDSVYFAEEVEDLGEGVARVTVTASSKADTSVAGAFFSLELPAEYYSEGTVQLINASGISFSEVEANGRNEYLRVPAKGVHFISSRRQLEILFEEPTLVIVKKDRQQQSNNIQVYLPILSGDLKAGQTGKKTFTIKASGEIDKEPIHLALNTSETGRLFAGIGGNFRLQNPDTDPQVIDYSLKNLPVAWGRVEMPWRFWQPDKDTDPIEAAKAGNLHEKVQKAMEMAQRLHHMGIPVIVSAWSGPDWAIEGEMKYSPGPDGVWGNPLNEENMNEIYQSIGDYISYMKENYGVDTRMFSFNESDLGINIRQTGEEHAELIKGLGAHFASRGLNTKLLLGDNSDANTYEFIYPAMNDPKAIPYIGAVSFHSWRGWEKETLEKWDAAADQLNVPLIVGEGSIDAAAWRYPEIFEERTYAMEEINLYTRILAICEPLTILQWQLTADYSPLAGGGIFGNNQPLRPTQRFWNLKQLGSTRGLKAMPVSCDRPFISCAALGDNKKNIYALHLVNNGTSREVTLTGLPKKVKKLHIYVTDQEREMKEEEPIKVSNGEARFTLDSSTFTTLISE